MIDWSRIERDHFEELIETLLCRRHDDADDYHRGYLGSGGDRGIDYIAVTAAGVTTIYQLKFFPEGIAANQSRMRQIRRSFAEAMRNTPDVHRWVLVLPAKVTVGQERKILALGGGNGPVVEIWDRTRLNAELSKLPDLVDYSRSHDEWLQKKAELLIKNPQITTRADAVLHVRELQRRLDHADPHWTYDVSTGSHGTTYALRAKSKWSPTVSPITMTVSVQHPSTASAALEKGYRFGFAQPVRISGELLRTLRVDGPPLVAIDEPGGFLEIRPAEVGDYQPVDVFLLDSDGSRSRTFLAMGRGLASGADGHTFEVTLGNRMNLVFRCPSKAGDIGQVDITVGVLTGASLTDVVDVAELITLLHTSSQLYVAPPGHSAGVGVVIDADTFATPGDYAWVWSLAEDLQVIEQASGARFRFPDTVEYADRVMIRNYRLMLEGRTVVHPFWNCWTGTLSGAIDDDLAEILAPRDDPQMGMMMACSPSDPTEPVEILGQQVTLPAITIAGVIVIDEEERRALLEQLRSGGGNGQPLRLTCRPRDRFRLYMQDRVGEADRTVITPWNLPGINQKGILEPEGSEAIDESVA